MNSNSTFFVVAATVSVELGSVMKTAKSMSLAAKNANVIAIRAGEQAVGFQAITDFIDELANNTMFLVKSINEIALETSAAAVKKLHADDALKRMSDVRDIAPNARYIASLDSVTEQQKADTKRHDTNFSDNLHRLAAALEEIQLQMRSAGVITSSCRVEASQLDEHRFSLEAVADNVELASNTIKTTLIRCQRLLSDAHMA